MKTVYAMMLLAALAGGCSRRSNGAAEGAQAQRELPTMTVDELSSMIERGDRVAVYDANGRARYEQGHVPGARWVGHDPLSAAVLPQDRAQRLVFYCANER